MDGYTFSVYVAIMLQDQLLIQMTRDGAFDDAQSTCKLQIAISDALSEVSKRYPIRMKKTIATDNGLIKRSLIAGDGAFVVAAVTADGNAVPYTIDYAGLHVGGAGTYEITYSPEIFDVGLEDEFIVPPEVGYVMLMHLVARNYCIMSGRTEEAAMFESRYNDFAEIDRLKRRARIPARKFV